MPSGIANERPAGQKRLTLLDDAHNLVVAPDGDLLEPARVSRRPVGAEDLVPVRKVSLLPRRMKGACTDNSSSERPWLSTPKKCQQAASMMSQPTKT